MQLEFILREWQALPSPTQLNPHTLAFQGMLNDVEITGLYVPGRNGKQYGLQLMAIPLSLSALSEPFEAEMQLDSQVSRNHGILSAFEEGCFELEQIIGISTMPYVNFKADAWSHGLSITGSEQSVIRFVPASTEAACQNPERARNLSNQASNKSRVRDALESAIMAHLAWQIKRLSSQNRGTDLPIAAKKLDEYITAMARPVADAMAEAAYSQGHLRDVRAIPEIMRLGSLRSTPLYRLRVTATDPELAGMLKGNERAVILKTLSEREAATEAKAFQVLSTDQRVRLASVHLARQNNTNVYSNACIERLDHLIDGVIQLRSQYKENATWFLAALRIAHIRQIALAQKLLKGLATERVDMGSKLAEAAKRLELRAERVTYEDRTLLPALDIGLLAEEVNKYLSLATLRPYVDASRTNAWFDLASIGMPLDEFLHQKMDKNQLAKQYLKIAIEGLAISDFKRSHELYPKYSGVVNAVINTEKFRHHIIAGALIQDVLEGLYTGMVRGSEMDILEGLLKHSMRSQPTAIEQVDSRTKTDAYMDAAIRLTRWADLMLNAPMSSNADIMMLKRNPLKYLHEASYAASHSIVGAPPDVSRALRQQMFQLSIAICGACERLHKPGLAVTGNPFAAQFETEYEITMHTALRRLFYDAANLRLR